MKIVVHNLTQKRLSFVQTLKRVFEPIACSKLFHIIIIDNLEMHKMNLKYRNIDQCTDVLSFPSDDDLSYGDVFICLDLAIVQAHEYGHSLRREVAFLSVHGYLHLIGYDHVKKKEEIIMNNLTEQILAQAKLYRQK